MIPPPFIERFKGDSGVDVGTEAIDAVFPDGKKIRVILRIGAPFKKEDRPDSYCIRVELENLDRTDGPLGGVSSLHAIVAAIYFIVVRLRIFEEKHGCRYFHPDSDVPFDYHTAFSTTK